MFAVIAWPAFAVVAALAASAMPHLLERRAARKFDAAVRRELAEVIDLLGVAVSAGLSIRLAIEAVTHRGNGPIARELLAVLGRADRGEALADALEHLPEQCGASTRPLASALISAERYGSPVTAALERLASDARASERREGEVAARRVPVQLLFPLVFCVLPAFALLTLGPLIAGASDALRLP
jgi:tight adherence protein C